MPKRSVWLVVDVPSMAAERIPDLDQAMIEFANKWIAEDRKYYDDPYGIQIGTAETTKLRIFVQER